jgi:hypothetical protein
MSGTWMTQNPGLNDFGHLAGTTDCATPDSPEPSYWCCLDDQSKIKSVWYRWGPWPADPDLPYPNFDRYLVLAVKATPATEEQTLASEGLYLFYGFGTNYAGSGYQPAWDQAELNALSGSPMAPWFGTSNNLYWGNTSDQIQWVTLNAYLGDFHVPEFVWYGDTPPVAGDFELWWWAPRYNGADRAWTFSQAVPLQGSDSSRIVQGGDTYYWQNGPDNPDPIGLHFPAEDPAKDRVWATYTAPSDGTLTLLIDMISGFNDAVYPAPDGPARYVVFDDPPDGTLATYSDSLVLAAGHVPQDGHAEVSLNVRAGQKIYYVDDVGLTLLRWSLAAGAPSYTTPPTISGSAIVGHVLTGNRGTWSGAQSFAYQWLRCDLNGDNCASINGATATQYQAAAADVADTLRLRVTASNSSGSTTADSDPTQAVIGPPALIQAPAISGTPITGALLTSNNGTWDATAGYDFQWLRCAPGGGSCVDIDGNPTSGEISQHRVVDADLGSTIAVRVTASNAGGSASATSAPTPVIETPLNAFAPQLKYNHGEEFFADSAAEITDNCNGSAGLTIPADSNTLFTINAGVPLPTADSCGSFPGFGSIDRLKLTYLGPTYTSSKQATSSDYIDESNNYQADYDTLHRNAEYANRIYGRVVGNVDGSTILQYWFFYYYQPNFIETIAGQKVGAHEGDWEGIQVQVDANGNPLNATYFQHGDGERCGWNVFPPDGFHPIVYVALDSHASWFKAESHSLGPIGSDIANGDGESPPIPTVTDITNAPRSSWVYWPGKWGGTTPDFPGDQSSPPGPSQKGDQWNYPLAWQSTLSCKE